MINLVCKLIFKVMFIFTIPITYEVVLIIKVWKEENIRDVLC